MEPFMALTTVISLPGSTSSRGFGEPRPPTGDARKTQQFRLGRADIERAGSLLPLRHPDIVFAKGIRSALVVDALLGAGRLTSPTRVVDLEWIAAHQRPGRGQGAVASLPRRVGNWVRTRSLRSAESRILETWDGVGVSTDEHAALAANTHDERRISRIPNVVSRPRLRPRAGDGKFRILLVADFGNAVDAAGVQAFVENVWPFLRNAVPESALTLVGSHENGAIAALACREGVTLHGTVTSMEPHYRDCDVVVVPELCRRTAPLVILEAMACGRAVVATRGSTQDLRLVHGREALIAHDMNEFAEVLIALARHPAGMAELVQKASVLQQKQYGPASMRSAVARLLDKAELNSGASRRFMQPAGAVTARREQ